MANNHVWSESSIEKKIPPAITISVYLIYLTNLITSPIFYLLFLILFFVYAIYLFVANSSPDRKERKKARDIAKLNKIIEDSNRINEEKKRMEFIRTGGFSSSITFSLLEIDEKLRKFRMPKNKYKIYSLDSIRSYDVIQDGSTVSSGGLGRAAVGAFVFGGVGSIVGAITGKKKHKNVINSLKIKLNTSDLDNPVHYIELINTPTKFDSIKVKKAIEEADKIIATLDILLSSEKEHTSANDSIEQIRQYKSLLDEGIITQEEFNIKKKELLE